MPSKAKHKNNAQSDKRNETTALLASGKQLDKDKVVPAKSRGSDKTTSAASQYTLPNTGLNQGLTFPRPPAIARARDSDESHAQTIGSFQGIVDTLITPKVLGPSTTSYTTDTGTRPTHVEPIITSPHNHSLRRFATQVHGAIGFTSHILAACSMRDAIAILILLLSLPPTLLLTVQTLFASLTYVPPTAGLAWAPAFHWPTLADCFHATASGGPSPFTIVMLDAIISILYLIFPHYMQNALMDIGQAIVAISLSGASAGPTGSADSICFCLIVVVLSQVFRHGAYHVNCISRLASIVYRYQTSVPAQMLHSETLILNSSDYSWSRVILGCHILAQGLYTLVRRVVAASGHSRQDNRQQTETISPVDAQRGGPYTHSIDSLSTPTPTSPQTAHSPSLREPKDKLSLGRRRRKQSIQVRSHQPLWAAIASTKVTFLKELEQKQTFSDVVDPDNAHDGSIFLTPLVADKVRIERVMSSEIWLHAEFATPEPSNIVNTSHDRVAILDADQSPCFVRLNGAAWASATISRQEHSAPGRSNWQCIIHGLTPLTSYRCEILHGRPSHLVARLHIITVPAPVPPNIDVKSTVVNAPHVPTSKGLVTPPLPSSKPLRSLSPTSTLKQSIAAAQVKVEDGRNKLKRNRREHKLATSAIRRESDQLTTRVGSSGGQDDRQRQRILQLKQTMKQTELAIAELDQSVEDEEPDSPRETDATTNKRLAWQSSKADRAAATQSLDDVKEQTSRESAQRQSDAAALAQKHERLLLRRSKLKEQSELLSLRQSEDKAQQQLHTEEHALKTRELAEMEGNFIYWTNETLTQTEKYNQQANENFQQTDSIRSRIQRHQQLINGAVSPEGVLPFVHDSLNPSRHIGNGSQSHVSFTPARPIDFERGQDHAHSMHSDHEGFSADIKMHDRQHYRGPLGNGHSSNGSAGSFGDQAQTRLERLISTSGSIEKSSSKGKAPLEPIGSGR